MPGGILITQHMSHWQLLAGRFMFLSMKPLLIAALLLSIRGAASQDCTQTLPINVLDQKTGNSLTSLRPESLEARMGGAAVQIKGLEAVEHRRLLVLVDVSASMAPTDGIGAFQKQALEAVEETMAELLQKLPSGTAVAYGFFNDKSVFTPDFLTDPAQLRNAIEETRKQLPNAGKGHTRLYDALDQALLRFGTPRPGDTVVLLTDAGENESKMHPGRVEKDLRRSGLRLVLLLVQQHLPAELTPYWDALIGLAEDTGGAVEMIDTLDRSWLNKKGSEPNREKLRRFWTEEALGGYVMQVQAPATLIKPRKWSLRINPAVHPELKHVTIQYPAKLAPCPARTAAVH